MFFLEEQTKRLTMARDWIRVNSEGNVWKKHFKIEVYQDNYTPQ